MKDLRDELKQLRFELELTQKAYCPKDEETQYRKLEKEKQELPEGVKRDDAGYFRYVDADLTKEELENLLLFRKIFYLRTIKNSAVFFVVLAILSLALSIIALTR